MTDRGRWASPARLLVGRRAGLECQRMPRGPAGSARRCAMGRLLLRGWQTKERGSPVCSTWGSAPSVRRANAAEPRGAREAGAVQVATLLRETRNLLLRLQGDRYPRNKVPASVRVQPVRLRSGERLQGSQSFSQLKLSEKQAKAIFISNDASHCVSCRRQRSPTVRMVG